MMSELNNVAKTAILNLASVMDSYATLSETEQKAFRHQLYQQTGQYGKVFMKKLADDFMKISGEKGV